MLLSLKVGLWQPHVPALPTASGALGLLLLPVSHHIFCYFICMIETGAYSIAQAGLELILHLKIQ